MNLSPVRDFFIFCSCHFAGMVSAIEAELHFANIVMARNVNGRREVACNIPSPIAITVRGNAM